MQANIANRIKKNSCNAVYGGAQKKERILPNIQFSFGHRLSTMVLICESNVKHPIFADVCRHLFRR